MSDSPEIAKLDALFHASPSMPLVSPEAGVKIAPHLNRARPELMAAAKAAIEAGAGEVKDRLVLLLLELDDIRKLCGEEC
jgi:hypothetical protein